MRLSELPFKWTPIARRVAVDADTDGWDYSGLAPGEAHFLYGMREAGRVQTTQVRGADGVFVLLAKRVPTTNGDGE